MVHSHRTQTSTPPKEHVLIYDNDCGVCVTISFFIQRLARQPLTLLPFSEIPGTGLLTDLSPSEVRSSAHYITPGGLEFHGGQAITRALRLLPAGWLFRVLDLPGLTFGRNLVYGLFASHRQWISRQTGTEACKIDQRSSSGP